MDGNSKWSPRLNRNNCVPNLASLVPKSIWPGTEGKCKLPTKVKLQLGSLKGRRTLKVGKASSWSTGSVASPLPHGRSFKRPYSLSDPGVERG